MPGRATCSIDSYQREKPVIGLEKVVGIWNGAGRTDRSTCNGVLKERERKPTLDDEAKGHGLGGAAGTESERTPAPDAASGCTIPCEAIAD